MPAIYAHFRMGEEVRENLDGEEKQAVEAYPELFRIGTHGPDILFYYRPLSRNAVSGLGHRMHAEAGGIFFERAAEVLNGGRKSMPSAEKIGTGSTADAFGNPVNDSAAYPEAKTGAKVPVFTYGGTCEEMKEHAQTTEIGKEACDTGTYDLASLAYVYGFLCHFALDVSCHGYIGEYIKAHGVSHAKIESELDRELMVRDGFDPVSHSIVGHLVPSDENARVISKFYGRGLEGEGNISSIDSLSGKSASARQAHSDPIPEITEKEIKKALRSMIFYSGMLLAPSHAKRAVLNFGMNIIGAMGFQDMMIGLTKDPKCEESTEALMERYEEAKRLALRLIKAYRRQFLTKEEAPDDIYGYNFESQLPS